MAYVGPSGKIQSGRERFWPSKNKYSGDAFIGNSLEDARDLFPSVPSLLKGL